MRYVTFVLDALLWHAGVSMAPNAPAATGLAEGNPSADAQLAARFQI